MVDTVAVKTHTVCEDCGSHDALSVYSDGHTYCFSCGVRHKGTGETYERRPERVIEIVESGKIREIADRCLAEETCRKFGVRSLVKDHKIALLSILQEQ